MRTMIIHGLKGEEAVRFNQKAEYNYKSKVRTDFSMQTKAMLAIIKKAVTKGTI